MRWIEIYIKELRGIKKSAKRGHEDETPKKENEINPDLQKTRRRNKKSTEKETSRQNTIRKNTKWTCSYIKRGKKNKKGPEMRHEEEKSIKYGKRKRHLESYKTKEEQLIRKNHRKLTKNTPKINTNRKQIIEKRKRKRNLKK